MNKNSWIAIGFIIIVVLVIAFTLRSFIFKGNPVEQANSFETKSSEGEVSIDLTPMEFKDGNFYINIAVNTHTVDLSQFNLNDLIELKYNNQVIKPESAPILSGHHNAGVLVFNTKIKPDKFYIIIRNIPDINERVFAWG